MRQRGMVNAAAGAGRRHGRTARLHGTCCTPTTASPWSTGTSSARRPDRGAASPKGVMCTCSRPAASSAPEALLPGLTGETVGRGAPLVHAQRDVRGAGGNGRRLSPGGQGRTAMLSVAHCCWKRLCAPGSGALGPLEGAGTGTDVVGLTTTADSLTAHRRPPPRRGGWQRQGALYRPSCGSSTPRDGVEAPCGLARAGPRATGRGAGADRRLLRHPPLPAATRCACRATRAILVAPFPRLGRAERRPSK